ncbi:DUF3106 domain-containing protein [Herbaspirillum sp. RTI4]|uniref:DUF3106 domain-containing protein n=1 Tax=Herbaspirillum sp. RTI4 TaxID=3048640 RepID=UPI002AB3D824|nr:DUF3106 domain-containing protein [Herbaspirillum sp. RTI4]MDY7578451.1 DUF3106 domain-containing protein [Herbaspirillum sp. RTI4]MEA9982535.1 DUF3106 domain-containing protein [Herbaspirillum sp. RTI4]
MTTCIVAAQTAPAVQAHGTTAGLPIAKQAKKIEATKPAWSELTPAQKQGLAPLAAEWDKIESSRKEKWLVIGNRYASMTTTDQQRVQERMREWLKLTPGQRKAVRENYSRAQKLDAEQKNTQWKEYLQLSEEQKRKFSESKLPKNAAGLPSLPSRSSRAIQLTPEPDLSQASASPSTQPLQTEK